MTHEPECRSFDGGHICICDVIRPAYQRGREDAAKSLIDLPASAWGENLSPLNFEAIFGAVRGDGEQA